MAITVPVCSDPNHISPDPTKPLSAFCVSHRRTKPNQINEKTQFTRQAATKIRFSRIHSRIVQSEKLASVLKLSQSYRALKREYYSPAWYNRSRASRFSLDSRLTSRDPGHSPSEWTTPSVCTDLHSVSTYERDSCCHTEKVTLKHSSPT